jgi:hypothetical protein
LRTHGKPTCAHPGEICEHWNQLMSGTFQAAYRRAREKIGDAAWALLSEREREDAVASELRAIEEERRRQPGSGTRDDPET